MSEATKISDYLIEGLLQETLFELAEAEMLVLFPFLGIPVLKQVFFFFFEKYASLAFKRAAVLSAWAIIEVEKNTQLKEAKQASVQYVEAIKSEDPERIAKARDEFKNRYRNLINLNP